MKEIIVWYTDTKDGEEMCEEKKYKVSKSEIPSFLGSIYRRYEKQKKKEKYCGMEIIIE